MIPKTNHPLPPKNQAFPFTNAFGALKSFLNLSPSSKSTKEIKSGRKKEKNNGN